MITNLKNASPNFFASTFFELLKNVYLEILNKYNTIFTCALFEILKKSILTNLQ